MTDLRALFPYFGGKSRAASLVWERFGRCVNYVEPFFGSGAVLLACPDAQRPRVETVNDANCFLANFWRATRHDPETVANHADWPVNECDLHARHRDLLRRGPALRALLEDPQAFDAEAAGWWVWGASAWIGSGWCEESAARSSKLPELSGVINGSGEHAAALGKGIHAAGMREPSRKLPALGSSGVGGKPGPDVGFGINGATNRTRLFDIFAALSERLRYTRVACGDWSRICTPAVTYRHGLTAVFLDPPYDGYEGVYGQDDGKRVWAEHDGKPVLRRPGEPLSARVRAWALEMGARPDMRIALCGYEGEHEMPGWECVAWKAKGGYSNQGDGENVNAKRERIWFSPACLRPGVDTGQGDWLAQVAP